MDETFWASVLKRWSDACDTVVSLKKDLKKAQAEADRHQEKLHALQSREEELLREHNHLKEEAGCKEYRDRSCALLKETEAFRRSQSQASSVGSHRPDDNTVDNIREAEHGLEKARHEYMKLKELLSKSSEQIRSLNTELKALQRDKEATEEHNCLLTKENIRIGLELTRSRSEYDALKEQLTVLQDLRNQNQGLKAEFIAQTQQLNNEIKRRNELESRCNTADAEVALRSQEIQVLTAAATVEKQHISALQDEILSMREKLSKSNETNKALLDNFTKLNEKLKDPTLAHPPQHPPRARPNSFY
ncbi:hypothetical protein FPV67DRAFT_1663230 [Lyophyllum atratum]|nr:hypothetical protein FPV67DRAFT_1663230 [Lyophyllum atratum]